MVDARRGPPLNDCDDHAATVRRTWAALFICALVLYAATANRGIQWQDPGYFILRVVTHEPFNPLGLALSHPLHHWLGRLAVAPGLLEPAFAVTLVSAVAGAVAVANVFGCIWTLTRNRWAGLLGAGSLALANTFWQMATRAECYTVSAALLSAECWCLAAFARSRRPAYLCAALLFNGLGFSNHNLALLTTPVLVVVMVGALVNKQATARHAALAAGLWVGGALLYVGMFVFEWLSGGDFAAAARSALFGNFSRRVLSTAVSPNLLLLSAGYVGYNFPNLLLPAAAVGLFRAGRIRVPPVARWALLAGLILHTVFVARYNVPDQYMFFVPTYVFLTIFGGVGFAVVLRTSQARLRRYAPIAAAVLLALTPVFYALAATAARHYELMRSVVRNKPYRDDYIYALAPWSVAETSAAELARRAVELAGPGGLIVIGDEMARYAVEYQALQTHEPPTIVHHTASREAILEAARDGRTTVLVPADRDRPLPEPPIGHWERNGDLYVLVPD